MEKDGNCTEECCSQEELIQEECHCSCGCEEKSEN